MRLVLRSAAAAGAVASALVLLPSLRASESVRVSSYEAPRFPAGAARPRQVIVQVAADAPTDADERLVRMAGGIAARRSPFARRYVVQLEPGTTIDQAIKRLQGQAEVEFVEPDGLVRAFFRPNDRLYAAQWHLQQLRAERTWDIQQGAPQIAVAVLDTGIAYEDYGPFRKAPDFGSTVFLPGFNVFDRSTHANDDNFHGTHVASIIAESTNNTTGAAGLAFGVALMPVKVLDNEGVGSFSAVADGIDYATNFTQNGQRPVKVINMSLGGEGDSTAVRNAVSRAVAAGITVVAASGNDDAGTVSFPAAIPNVIAVGAVDGRKQKAPYSNFGAALDLVAYGGDIRRDDTGENGAPDGRPDGILQQTFDPETAFNEGRYDDFAYFFVVGTSQASPQVAGLAAMLVQQGITTPAGVQHWMEQTAEDLGPAGRDDRFGHGLIRPVEALTGLGVGVK